MVTSPSIEAATREVFKKKRKLLRGSASGPGKRSFHAPHSDFSFPTPTPVKTVLQKYLRKGEFPLFQRVAMFESSFLQVTRRGKHVFFHNHYHEAIIGIASTNIKLPLPNLMFIARPAASYVSEDQYPEELMLTRLLPLKFVHISIYDSEKQLIKIKLINGRSYYLQLYASTEEEKDLFNRWLSLVYLLHHPPPCYLQPHPKSCMQVDELSVEFITSDEEVLKEQERKKKKKKHKPPHKPPHKTETMDSITKEAYTEYEQLILQAPFAHSEWSFDELESYQGSSMTQQKAATICSTESELSATLSSLSISRSSPIKIPEKGEQNSLKIVPIFSIVSKTLEEEQGGKSKSRAGSKPDQSGGKT